MFTNSGRFDYSAGGYIAEWNNDKLWNNFISSLASREVKKK